uniref:Acetylcholine receptor neuronal subunit alpha 2-like 213 n=1 Tax=Saccoglossus kowalevskii TaxID=10224 RepID=A0A0U2IDR0_SACKO|nr:acetylcholine receptor neuronal subunit alpha 2-like 213 [Saccoglossus kowalevskii]
MELRIPYLLLCSLCTVTSSDIPAYDIFTRLRKDLFENYDRYSRPAINADDSIRIDFGLSLNQLVDVDEKNQMITTRVWLNQEWRDIRLTWNPANYSGVDNVIVPFGDVWYPDMVLYNSGKHEDNSYVLQTPLYTRIYYDGTISMGPPTMLISPCLIDILHFPFDEQSCHLSFGTWEYTGNETFLQPMDDHVVKEDYLDNVEWEVIDSKAESLIESYPCCPQVFSLVTFTLVMRRKPLYYLINLTLPCAILTILTLFTFYLPADSGEKLTLGISILLTLSVLSVIVSDTLPATSTGVPLIEQYIIFSMALVMMSVIMTIVIVNVNHRNGRTYKLTPRVRKFMLQTLPPYLCLRPVSDDNREHTAFPENGVGTTSSKPCNKVTYRKQNGQQNVAFLEDWSYGNIPNYLNGPSCEYGMSVINSGKVSGMSQTDSLNQDSQPESEQGGESPHTSSRSQMNVDRSTQTVNTDSDSDTHDGYKTITARNSILQNIYEKEIAIENHVKHIAGHMRHVERDHQAREDWKYVAMVIDRIMLIVFVCGCFIGTCALLGPRVWAFYSKY